MKIFQGGTEEWPKEKKSSSSDCRVGREGGRMGGKVQLGSC